MIVSNSISFKFTNKSQRFIIHFYNGLSKGHPTDDILAGEQIYYNYLIIKIIFVADCLTRFNSLNG